MPKVPALLSLVEEKWIEQAFECFSKGQKKIYFVTDAPIGKGIAIGIKHVYFKFTGKKDSISLRADLIEITDRNPKKYRLFGCENDEGKYYYGFKNFKWLKIPLELEELQYFTTGRNLPRDLPGACIVIDPEPALVRSQDQAKAIPGVRVEDFEDGIIEQVCSILEGGEAAFESRKRKCQISLKSKI